MMKKILLLALCMAVFMSTVSMASFTDVENDSLYGKAISVLSEAGILSGYGNGEFGSKDPLTRAQFAKIIIALSGYEDVAKTKTSETFTDVSSSHWAVGYINEASNLGLITGYPDGSFGAEENITYAQALTIIIRALGYTEAEVGKNWPVDYLNKAEELKLTEGLSFKRNDYITREVAAYVIYNSLTAKEGSKAGSFMYTKVENVIIYGLNSVNSGIAIDEVLTSGGTFKDGKVSEEDYLGKKVTLRVNSDKEIVMITPEEQTVKSYKVKAASNDKFETTDGEYIEIDGNIPTYYKGAKSTYGALYSSLVQGSVLNIYEDYIYVEENKLKGPYTITSNYQQVYTFFGDIENADVTIDGESAEITDIEKYDVCYYNDITERLYVYTERATGIYQKATPSKENITGLVLSGTTYSSLSMNAKAKLDDTPGSFKIHDRITLLFGNDGSVVDVVDSDGRTMGDMGVLLKAYSALSTEEETLGNKEYYADIILADGNTVSYKTDKDYSDTSYYERIGKFFYITSLNDGTVKLEAAEENKLTGEFDKSVPSYAEHKLMQNYSILEYVYSERYKEAIVRKINLKDINVKSLSEEDIIHVEYANDLQDIAVIYVNNITNDAYKFGILTKAEKDTESNYTYELKTSSGSTTYTGSAGWDYVKGEAVMILSKDNKIKDIKELPEVAADVEIEGYTGTGIRVSGKSYDMDEDVTIVYKYVSKSDWNITTIKDLTDNIKSGEWKINTLTLYADKKTGGKVRVIRVSLK